jgi:hypothetical protein
LAQDQALEHSNPQTGCWKCEKKAERQMIAILQRLPVNLRSPIVLSLFYLPLKSTLDLSRIRLQSRFGEVMRGMAIILVFMLQ